MLQRCKDKMITCNVKEIWKQNKFNSSNTKYHNLREALYPEQK